MPARLRRRWRRSRKSSAILGVFAGIAAALIVALAQAVLSVTIRANQLVVGIGFNILILGVTTFFFREIRGAGASDLIPGLPVWRIPGLADIPVLGPALFQHSSLFYIGLVLVVVTWALLSHTSFGLAVTAVGEDPSAADKAGVDVNRARYLAVLYAGAMAGVAGAFLSVADLDTFTEGMTKGAGYLALASVIFGGWTSWRTAVACLLFGAATALQFSVARPWYFSAGAAAAHAALCHGASRRRRPSGQHSNAERARRSLHSWSLRHISRNARWEAVA